MTALPQKLVGTQISCAVNEIKKFSVAVDNR